MALGPQVRYATADDGVRIAYSVIGQGGLTIVLAPGFLSQIEVMWDEPLSARFLASLAGAGQLVLFDRRGVGLSDRVTEDPAGLAPERLAADIEAVLDAVEADRAVVAGLSMGGLGALQFAADHPERVVGLLLISAAPCAAAAADYLVGWAGSNDREDASVMLLEAWGTGALAPMFAPSMAEDRRFVEWVGRLERHSCSPGMVVASYLAILTADLRPRLGDVQAPTLLLYRDRDPVVDVGHGRYMAEHIRHARLVELPGADHLPMVGDQDSIVEEILVFLEELGGDARVGADRGRASRQVRGGWGWESLTEREDEVAVLVAEGMTNVEVARRLAMSRHTVDAHLRRVFRKLGVTNRAELAKAAARRAG